MHSTGPASDDERSPSEHAHGLNSATEKAKGNTADDEANHPFAGIQSRALSLEWLTRYHEFAYRLNSTSMLEERVP